MKKIFTTLILLFTALMPIIAQNNMERLEKQAVEIISKMTLDEKISQMMNETPGIERLGIEYLRPAVAFLFPKLRDVVFQDRSEQSGQ